MRDIDSDLFVVLPITIGRQINKYDLLRRILDEWHYGRELIRVLSSTAPDLVISGNCSPIVQMMLRQWSRKHSVPFIYWLQDIYAIALQHAFYGLKRLALLPATALLRWMEFGTIASADAVVAISENFRTLLADEGIPVGHVEVIENWAPVDDIPMRPKSNAWSQTVGVADKFVFLYSGTLGLKHNPKLLSDLAKSFTDDPHVRVIVISEGLGRDWLEERKKTDGLDNLLLFDFVPFESVPDCLGSADVQVAILEPLAGTLSVPSKVLTYIAAEKPILGAIPVNNLAAEIITRNKLGINVQPTEIETFILAAKNLRKNAKQCAYREALQAYKRKHFNIEDIGNTFLAVFERALCRRLPLDRLRRVQQSTKQRT